MLFPFGQHVIRNRNRYIGTNLSKYFLYPALMHRRDIGEQQADCDRLDTPISGNTPRHVAHAGFVERNIFLAARGNAPGRFVSMAALHQRLGFDPGDVVMALPLASLDKRYVAEALRRDISDRRAFALKHRIGGDGGAEAEMLDIVRRPGLLKPADDALAGIVRRRQRLPNGEVASISVVGDEIRKGAADVYAYILAHANYPASGLKDALAR